MATSLFELNPNDHRDDADFKVTLETGTWGMARLNVACLRVDSDDQINAQGVDLNEHECIALANALLSVASILQRKTDGIDTIGPVA